MTIRWSRGLALVVGLAAAVFLSSMPARGASSRSVRSGAAVNVKFADAASISVSQGRFAARDTRVAATLNGLVEHAHVATLRKLIDSAIAHSIVGVALRSYYVIQLTDQTGATALTNQLKRLPFVQEAYVAPQPAPPPTTPNFTSLEKYARRCRVQLEPAT